MREIKFRGFHGNLNRMVYGLTVRNSFAEWKDEKGVGSFMNLISFGNQLNQVPMAAYSFVTPICPLGIGFTFNRVLAFTFVNTRYWVHF